MSNRLFAAILAACLLALVSAAALADEPALETDDQKTLYAIGIAMSRQLANFGLSESDLVLIQAGLTDGALGHPPRVELQVYGPKIEAFLNARLSAMSAKNEESGKAFREKMAQEPGAVTTPEGMVFISVKEGEGAIPTLTDTVKVDYHGTFPDGRVFDSSRESGQPATFPVNGVVPCFSQAIQRMKVGGTAKVVCPPGLAYGDKGAPPMVPPGATLMFEIELLDIVSSKPTENPAP